MISSNNAINIITCLTYKQVARKWINENLHGGESDKEVKSILQQKCRDYLDSCEDFDYRKEKIVQSINTLNDHVDGVVALGDPNFPKITGNVKPSDRPVILFYKGDISLISNIEKNVAVIGVLNPTEDIIRRERRIIDSLVDLDCTIVSGLALGCDSTAHQQTLDRGGKTVAILPGTLSDIIPASNKAMANDIVIKNGLLVSEYFQKPKSKYDMIGRFVERDRLQAMFSKAIVLSASYAQNNEGNDSGSRHAMSKAKEYGRSRYVMYNIETDVDNKMFDLSRQLLKEDRTVKIASLKSIEELARMKQLQEELNLGF